MRAAVGAAALVALLALPVPAQALENLGFADVVTDSLYVTGDSVTYADRQGRDTDGFAVVRRDSASAVLFDRLEDPPGRDRFHQYEEFGASEQRYAFGFAEYLFGGLDDEPTNFGFFSGAADAEAAALLECDGDPGVPNLAVSGDAVAWQPAACSGRDIVVRDLAPGAAVPARTIPLTQQVAELKLAGRYVAYALVPRDTDATSPEVQVVVHDWVAGAEAYRARASQSVPFYGGPQFAPFDLQADGKIVLVSALPQSPIEGPDTCPDRFSVAWFSPAEPTPHVLPVRSCVPDYRLEADRIAFFTGDGTGTGARLVVSDLAGDSIASLARFRHYRTGQHFDIDSTRAAFTSKGCLLHRLNREVLAPAGESLFKVPTCNIRIASSAGRISGGGIATIRYECPRGCSMYTRIQRPFSTEIKGTGIRSSGVVRFRVPASARARLQREGSLLLRVFAAIDDSVPVVKRRFAANVRLRAR